MNRNTFWATVLGLTLHATAFALPPGPPAHLVESFKDAGKSEVVLYFEEVESTGAIPDWAPQMRPPGILHWGSEAEKYLAEKKRGAPHSIAYFLAQQKVSPREEARRYFKEVEETEEIPKWAPEGRPPGLRTWAEEAQSFLTEKRRGEPHSIAPYIERKLTDREEAYLYFAEIDHTGRIPDWVPQHRAPGIFNWEGMAAQHIEQRKRVARPTAALSFRVLPASQTFAAAAKGDRCQTGRLNAARK